MVGVPHSTGCALCRERHIKCDEAVPECTQCQRYGKSCPGYRRTFRFQDEGPNLERRHRSTTRRKPRQVSRGPSTSRTAKSASAPASTQAKPVKRPEHSDAASAADIVRENAIALMRRHSTVALDENLSPSLVRKSFQAAQPQLFLDFISASFPTLYFHNRFRAGSDPGFAEFIVMNFGADAYLDSAICCLSSVYLAHLTQDPVLLQTSRRLYGLSLSEVVRALSKPQHAMSDNMLCTAMMLSVYEMYAQTSPEAWVVHSDAVRRLMVSRGPQAHRTGFGRSCWIAFRGFHIATAVYQGKPCFLDGEEWQSYSEYIMSEDCQKPGEWSAYAVISDKVFMEIARCPRYISESRELLSSETESQEAIEALIQRISDTSNRLKTLTAELSASINAHSQRQQGIIRRPGTFVGPVPEIFPETGPSLLLRGSENIQATLRQISTRLQDRLRFQLLVGDFSPESAVESPRSDGSVDSLPSSASSVISRLPFRIYSEIGRGPSHTSDRNDPRAVIWLDRVASSMGVLGTKVIADDPVICHDESPREVSGSRH
ncbi:uncharacterized protein N7477_009544 [Penicillium maclennaniae]|uniref:uncharacterized protein n=1 Tax=Penicillium maclennaniae TaxID=1343394 RepID=UPI0025425219|nr:uncharacterized protein N7477_009544 [Penicillium maclennaniae]KAJ5661928.1 hypothetical protein N7477_009544 [Penicillium maclennaniae]